MTKKSTSILIFFIVLLVLFCAVFLLKQVNNPTKQLSEQEARQAVLDEYPGTVLSMDLQDGIYLTRLETSQGLYELKLAAATGEIASIVQLESTATAEPSPVPTPAGTEPPAVPATPSPSASPATPPAASARPPAASTAPTAKQWITEKQAVYIALQEVPGELDDVDFENGPAGSYYLIEVNHSDGREAVVQVNAVSGAVMSIAWEKKDDDDNS
ncbi:PepSY domain-containing protein [Paenibacillus albidus]|uniref:PepSY domain-containing protein n=1 Tax=Paenibacillus albidus TaxID=2041023 RepID=UPI001BE558BA|nr:PepSY domain-containing protein [Paenibacillus albidus]MBT2287799.1 PepSY domain-containing protein [Paenibacillus albidus]